MMRKGLLTGWVWSMVAPGLAGCLMMGIGCMGPPARRNAPPQGITSNPHEISEHDVHMVDNAMLADMSMSPAHFVPNTPELNALGVRRLNRLASILKIYGGTLGYDGAEKSEELKEQRLKRIRGYLIASGVVPECFEVKAAAAGDVGMQAVEAVEIRRATRFQPASGGVTPK